MEQIDLPTELIDMLPIGYYELDGYDHIVRVDDTWLLMHDVSREEAIGEDIHMFYADPAEADLLRDAILEAGHVKGITRLLKKKRSGGWFYGSIYSVVKRDETGAYAGRKGAVLDTTRSEMYKRITDEIPIGFFLVRTENDKHSIAYCNKAFAKMFGFKRPREAIGYNIGELYQRERDHLKFLRQINDNREQKGSSIGLVDVKSIDGRLFTVEATVQWEKNGLMQVVERSGVFRDLSKDAPLIELRQDLGRVLHTYSSNLTGIRLTLESIRRGLEPDSNPFGEQLPTIEQREQALSGPTHSLIKELKLIEETAVERKLPDNIVTSLIDLLESVERAEDILPELRIHLMQEIAITYLDLYPRLSQEGRLPREALKQARSAALDLRRVINLILIHDKERDVMEIDYEVHALRDYATEGLRHDEARAITDVDLWRTTVQAMKNFADFAHKQGVSFRAHNLTKNSIVRAVKRDLIRAIGNLLHNAIKYSWERSSGVFVRVILSETNDKFSLMIENYGVPIPEDEIELIFEYGYRSRVAGDRNRIGTGIGLHDTNTVIEKMGGNIYVDSKPARGMTRDPRQELVAHVTTVIVTLPKTR